MKISTKDITLVALFAALACITGVALKLGGEAIVPFSALPLVVMLAGALLGSFRGALAMLVYLLIGLVGLPVFSKGGGPAYIFQPSFGFLIGFVVAAFVVGKMLEIKDNPPFWYYYLAMVAGLLAIYLVGLPYLYLIVNFYLGAKTTVLAMIFQAKSGFPIAILFLFDLVKAVLAVAIAKPVTQQLKATSS